MQTNKLLNKVKSWLFRPRKKQNKFGFKKLMKEWKKEHNDKAIIVFFETEQGDFNGIIRGKKSVLLEMTSKVIDCLKEK